MIQISTPRNLPKRNKNIYSHKDMFKNVHSSIIHNRQKPEATQRFTKGRWINKLQYSLSTAYLKCLRPEGFQILDFLGFSNICIFNSIFYTTEQRISEKSVCSACRSWPPVDPCGEPAAGMPGPHMCHFIAICGHAYVGNPSLN